MIFDAIESSSIEIRNRNVLSENYSKLLKILLKDHTTNKNILWMTDNYENYGETYSPRHEITVDLITKENEGIIRPRINKSFDEQIKRIRNKAEVFTPSWVCNKQNNQIDEKWFGRNGVFNTEIGICWISSKEKIKFPSDKTWKDYVLSNRLEISCGEAPYLVSRYDTTTGKFIELKNRIGMLDRKIRIVSENTELDEDWLVWVKKAFQSTYGFEWQGDNLLLARENLILTFIDYYMDRFSGKKPEISLLLEIAEIVSWNLWQMDGIKFVVPESCHDNTIPGTDLFGNVDSIVEPCDGCKSGKIDKHNGIQCLIKDWKENKVISALSLLMGDK